jgi:xylulokinase
MEAVLGIDIGTTITEGTMVSITSGNVLADCSVRYPPGFANPLGHPLGAEQVPKVWKDAALRVTNELALEGANQGVRIRAIAISSMVGGLNIPMDRDMSPLRSVPIWLDQRAVREAQASSEVLDSDHLRTVTGNGDISPYFGFIKLLWYMANDSENYRRTHALVTPSAWVVHMLTGEHVTDMGAMGAFGGVLDLKKGRVSEELTQQLGELGSKLAGEPMDVSPSLFGTPMWPGEVIGPVTAEGAGVSGLPEGVPVVVSGVDASVALLASGGRGPGDNTLIMGTSWYLGVLTDRTAHTPTPGMVHIPHALHGERLMFSMTGGSYTGGTAGFWLPEMVTRSSFSDLEREAKLVPPGSGGVTFLPYLMGDRTPLGRPDATGAFLGLRAEHTRAHLFRAVLEGGAILHGECVEEARTMGVDLAPTRVVDGAYGSSLWRRMVADVTGKNVLYLSGYPGTSYGDAMLAAIGTGSITEDKAFGWLPEVETIEPTRDPESVAAYGEARARYRRYRDVLSGS